MLRGVVRSGIICYGDVWLREGGERTLRVNRIHGEHVALFQAQWYKGYWRIIVTPCRGCTILRGDSGKDKGLKYVGFC